MASFDAINYSLRPSKNIQRNLVFEGIRKLHPLLNFESQVYVGLGSIWFTDFMLAHNLLGIMDMVSIEAHPIGFRRARFNAPYATVRVKEGRTSAVLPALYDNAAYAHRPWLIWLDYDGPFDEEVKDDARSVLERAPANSIFLVTVNGYEKNYGQKPADRPERLRTLFGDSVPDDLPIGACREGRMQETLARSALNYMKSVAVEVSRPGGFVTAFSIVYRDGSPMVTVGGLLPVPGNAAAAAAIVAAPGWNCMPSKPIVAPHLTLREALLLQSQLPCNPPLDRMAVHELGFDLEDEQIEAFEVYYRYYPAFAQIMT